MPAFKVRAMMGGEYAGNLYSAGQEFFLVDRKDPDTGEILQKAEEAFVEFKNRKHGSFGWMQRVGASTSTETPEQRLAREAAEAQRKADVNLMLGSSKDPNDPSLMLNAAGTSQVPKIQGGMGWDGTGKNPNDNDGAGITMTSLLDAGYTEAEATELLKEHGPKGRPSLATPTAMPAPLRPVAAPAGGKDKASGAARAAVGAPAAAPAPVPAAPAATAAPAAPAAEASQSATEVI